MGIYDMKPVQLIFIAIAIALVATVMPVTASENTVNLPTPQWKNTTSLVLGFTNSTSTTVNISTNQWKDIASLVRGFTNNNAIATVSVPTPTYSEKDNGTVVSLTRNSVVKVQLNENPSTGFSWNVTTTPGIQVLSSSHLSSHPGRPGAGGIHTWVLKINGTGIQQFTGIYKQPWMPTSENDSRYILSFNVTLGGTTGFN
jgi:predicted secreted protein